MAQAKKKSALRRLAAWANNITLVMLPLFLQFLVFLDRHPLEAPVLWKMKSEIEIVLMGLAPADISVIRPHYVVVLIMAVAIIYLIKLIGALAIPSLRSMGRLTALLTGMLILLAPVTLGRAGVCAYEFHRASADDIFSRAIMIGIKNGNLDPAITTVDDYYQQHDRKTCCSIVSRKGGLPTMSDVFAEFSVGRLVDVTYAGDATQHQVRVEMCGRTALPWTVSR